MDVILIGIGITVMMIGDHVKDSSGDNLAIAGMALVVGESLKIGGRVGLGIYSFM